MKSLPTDPLQNGIVDFSQRLRLGHTSVLETTKAYLARIASLNPKLDAYSFVAEEQSIEMAKALDHLLSIGVDLGPLMGVPVGVKDLFAVTGMPTAAGSNLDLTDCVGLEGTFIKSLRKAGCVILGKTRTTEFAAGAQNLIHPTSWNPCDMEKHRTPGGSSHGSAVAVAAGLCGFAIGSDTGGSVRQPAALCGIVGLKTTHGIWPTDGIFPLCPSLDTVGLLTAGVSDAAVAYAALTDGVVAPTVELAGVRLGVLDQLMMESMDIDVADSYELSLRYLEAAGVKLIPISWPNKKEQLDIKAIFANMVPADLLATIGRERFKYHRHEIDPVAIKRIEEVWDLPAVEYIKLNRLKNRLSTLAKERMFDLDGIVGPTCPIMPMLVSELSSVSTASEFVARSLSYTRAANVYDMCSLTIPVPQQGRSPAGLQITCSARNETKLLSLATALSAKISTGYR
ncbi:amidase [Halomonas sp. NPDC076908]|uniref:amidase n=1 Tax=Halomonas sp. NPDC076908 TaxID=3390567 RepID=UPI003D0649FD